MKRRVLSFIIALTLCLNLCPMWAFAAEADLSTDHSYEMVEDRVKSSPFEISSSFEFNTNGYTYTFDGTNSPAIRVYEGGKLDLTGTVTVVAENAVGIEVQSGGFLSITKPNTSITGGTYALDIASGADVHLSTGKYSAMDKAIRAADGNFAEFLEPGCAYFDYKGDLLLPADAAMAKILVVDLCSGHSDKDWAHTSGATEHSWTCPYCGTVETEACTFTFDQNGTGNCASCESTLTIAVDERDLTGLVYDGTVKPEDVSITVTLRDGSNKELAKKTDDTDSADYEVKYVPRTDAGEITVTVTGITFNGTFTKTYHVEQDTPGIRWDNTTACAVDYDGLPVDNLPNIIITIKASEDLHPYLQYFYRKVGETEFTGGLPTNAGTYEVKAYLPESRNYKEAETGLLTLTINKIPAVATAPTAKTLTYNREAQQLVTAGVLEPGAVAEGARIEFKLGTDGTYSTDIPTGIGVSSYNVYYRVAETTNYSGVLETLVENPDEEYTSAQINYREIKPTVELEYYTTVYTGGDKEPKVTAVKDGEYVIPNSEYEVTYTNNRNVGTAKVTVTNKANGNYTIKNPGVTVEFQITSQPQAALSITKQPDTVTYGDKFTLGTSGGSGSGDVTWEIIDVGDVKVAEVGPKSGQVTIVGDGEFTVKATKSGTYNGVTNYDDATATWTVTADKKPVTATVTAEDKSYGETYDGTDLKAAKVHAVVEQGVLPGDVITITGLTGTFEDGNAGEDKKVTVDTSGASIGGTNSEHYAVTYSSAPVKATIHKAVVHITTGPDAANLTYSGTAQALIDVSALVIDTAGVSVEYALSENGPYNTAIPTGTNAGAYTVWYRVKDTDNYTGVAPASVDVTISKKPVTPTIMLSGEGLTPGEDGSYSYVYDGNAKEPVVTVKDGEDVIPASNYTVDYSNNVNVSSAENPAKVTVTAKADGNYEFTTNPATATFEIKQEQAKVLTAPEAAGDPLTFANRDLRLVTPGTGYGGKMVYSLTKEETEDKPYSEDIPTGKDAKDYTVYYKVKGDGNHIDSTVGSVKVTIAPKRVDNPTIELLDGETPLVSYTYDGNAKKPSVVVMDGSDVIFAGDDSKPGEYNIVYRDNVDAGRATVEITDKPGGNYTVTGSMTFVIQKADIKFSPAPSAADITYDGNLHELLNEGAFDGGTVQYALNSATSTYSTAIPQGSQAGNYTVYYKVIGDKNHNDLAVQSVPVTIKRKELTTITIELSPEGFEYDGSEKMPTVTVKDGNTVLPKGEYTATCTDASNTVTTAPTTVGTYTITISDEADGNYDLSKLEASASKKDFTIGKIPQEELVIGGKPAATNYGDSFQLTVSGGSGTGAVTSWNVTGPATVDTSGNVTITGVGEVTVTVEKAGDTNYLAAETTWTSTAAPKPVTATVEAANKVFDGKTGTTVTSAGITTINGDTVTIEKDSIIAAFDTPTVGEGKTVTLDTSNVKVTGDHAAKYAISYPETVTANITQAAAEITTDPAKIDPLTFNGQPQALVTAGETNVGFIVYSLDNVNFSKDIPTGTDAGDYTVYYKVDETTDYTGVTPDTDKSPISVTIAPKTITPEIELSEDSYLYDGTKKNPTITVKDDETVIDKKQYTVTWKDNNGATVTELAVAGTYKATIENVANGNYTFSATATVKIVTAEQAALNITGQPDHVCYGDKITTLGTTGGTGDGKVTWSITAGKTNSTIDEDTGVLTVKDIGTITVKAERTVPNYAPVSATWTFTVEPKPVTAEVTITPKDYDGTRDIANSAITAAVKPGDLVNSADSITFTGQLMGTYVTASAGTGKMVTLDTSKVQVTGIDAAKYAVTIPAMAQADINPRAVTVTVTLSDHDLTEEQKDGNKIYFYTFDGTEKKPAVTVTGSDETPYSAALADSDYGVDYAKNKNFGTADVTVTAKEGGNYTFAPAKVTFEIRKGAAVLTETPKAKDLTYDGTDQDLVTVGTATGGTVVYSSTGAAGSYSETIPQGKDAKTYTIYYKVRGDGNHNDTAPGQVSVTIRPKEITPIIALSGDGWLTESDGTYSCEYDGSAKKPTVTVTGGVDANPIDGNKEYTVSYQDNTNAGIAKVIVSDANGGNYIVNGTAYFEITKKAPAVTLPEANTGLQYNGAPQDLVKAGVSDDGTVVYSVNGGNYSAAVPSAAAVGDYEIKYKVLGDQNHSNTEPVTLGTVTIAKNTVNTPAISLSSDQFTSSDTFTYNGRQQKPAVTVYDDNGLPIPANEYTVEITGADSNIVNVGTYTVTVTTPDSSNYIIKATKEDGTVINTRTFEIVPANQETISITGTKAQVRYGDTIQLGVTGTGSGTVDWVVTGNSTISANGLLTVKDVGGPIKVTVTRTADNYNTVSATWEFSAAKKQVTAVVTAEDRTYAADDTSATVRVSVPDSELVPGDSIKIEGVTGSFGDSNVGTNKKVTVDRSNASVTGTNADNYEITYPATTTATITAVAATVDTDKEPKPKDNLTYNASQAQELVTAGEATGGIMVYSLDGINFTPSIPKAKDAGTYTVYFKAQGDGNHTDSEIKSTPVTIGKQSVTPTIELSPSSAKYDGEEHKPTTVTLWDGANNVIPDSEYKVTYVTDGGKNWTEQGTYTVKIEDINRGNYVIVPAEGQEAVTATFTISTTAQNPLTITNKPGLVYYGDTFTLSAVGGSGNAAVTWSVDDAGKDVVEIDQNGFVKIKSTGLATITATKPGGANYETATAEYPLNALKKPVTAIVAADDKVYDGNTPATTTIHVTWNGLVGNDTINTSALTGTFDSPNVGQNKTVTISNGSTVTDTRYEFTIPGATTASILKADTAAPDLAANDREYDRTAQPLVTGGNANTTVYSTTRDGVYSENVPTGTNAGTYTVWYKELGDANHNDSAPQAKTVTISRKTLTTENMTITLSGNDLTDDGSGNYSYVYDSTEKKPTVTIKDGNAVVPSSEYKVEYSNNKNVSKENESATVTITSNEGGNYTFDKQTVNFEITSAAAQLTKSPEAKNLTYLGPGQAQELVTIGTAIGGKVVYSLTKENEGDEDPYSETIPQGTNAGTYTVYYKVKGDGNYADSTETWTVSVTIKPKEIVSPKVNVTGTYTYNGSLQEPAVTAVTVVDGTGDKAVTIPSDEYTVSYRDNVEAGPATVIITNANGGNYIVNGTGTFTIGKAAASVEEPPTGKENLPYNGTAQALVEAGKASGGSMVYSLNKDGEYSTAIPTKTAVGNYEVWYKVQGDANHNDTDPAPVNASIVVNAVTDPTVQVTPESVTWNGKKQEPTVKITDNNGFVIDGSEYTVKYVDGDGNEVTNPTNVGTYTLTITGKEGGNYTFTFSEGKQPTFEILLADQTPLTITGTRERVCYGDKFQLGTTGGNGAVTWDVGGSDIATITNGLLEIKGVGSVTVKATCTAPGYNEQAATWTLYAEKKPVTAVVTAATKTYDGVTPATTTVTATLQSSDLVSGDTVKITLSGSFDDPNAGTDKKVKIDSTSPVFTGSTGNYENYSITYPATTTASIFKANVTDVTPPTVKTGLEYTGLAQALVTPGSVTGGTLEYSTDNITYSASLPTGTNADSYDVWYRVKGDSNHNDTAGTKLTETETEKVTIAKQEVKEPIIEFDPNGASYDGGVHKPTVIVKDSNGRVIPESECVVTYSSDTDWTTIGKHKVTIEGKATGNYSITKTEKEFEILLMGQNPLSIMNQPGRVQYGDSFTLSAVGGSGTGTIQWSVTAGMGIVEIDQNGLVKVLKAGGPVTIKATKAASGSYSETTAEWTFSAEKKPVKAVVTAKNKEYDAKDEAKLVITWKDGDLLGNDSITLNLTGTFEDANVGNNKKVTITINGTAPTSDKYEITWNGTTTASITPAAATVTAPTPIENSLTYTGSEQPLVNAGSATNGTILYSLDDIIYSRNIPKGKNAGTYTVWYKVEGNANYADVAPQALPVAIAPKTVSSPDIELSPESFDYDGNPKKPDVTVKDGNIVIPAGEYTVGYSNNVNKGDAKVIISDAPDGNYIVNGEKTFTIKAGAATLTVEPEEKDLTYTGSAQALVTRGTAVNGRVMYALDDDEFSTTIPKGTNAGDYEVWYMVKGNDGYSDTEPDYVTVTIKPKVVTPTIKVGGKTSYSTPYTGDEQEPDVTVTVEGKTLTEGTDYYVVGYSDNTNPGTATVTVASASDGNYQFYADATFMITKVKAEFQMEPEGKTGLVYTGEAQDLVEYGTGKNGGTVVYSLGSGTYYPFVPTATEVGSYVVLAKVQGGDLYADSDVKSYRVTIGKNTIAEDKLNVTLSDNSLKYTGSELKPTVTVRDSEGNIIAANEYSVTYSKNINVGQADVTVTSTTKNYSFSKTEHFQITDADAPTLKITGKQDTVCYGDTLRLGTTGGSGAVTWSVESGSENAESQGDGRFKIKGSGSITVKAETSDSSDTWSFYADPKPVKAIVTAASKPFDNSTTATLTVTVTGLVSGDSIGDVTASGYFTDANAGTNKTVVVAGLNVSEGISAKYDISYPETITADITPAPATVKTAPEKNKNLTNYTGQPQALVTPGEATGGKIKYSLDGETYTYAVPTGTNAGPYTVWYKVVADDDNYKDSKAVEMASISIAPNTTAPTVECKSAAFTGAEQTPTVIVTVDNRTLPEDEYKIEVTGTPIAVGDYTVTVKDKANYGNYEFSTSVTATFKIVSADQNPLSIITDKSTVNYGDSFRLSAMGGSGGGEIKWSIKEENAPASISSSGVVTVTGTGGFTVQAYREAAGGYSASNTDSVPFVANPKPITAVATAVSRGYNAKKDTTVTVTVAEINATITTTGTFADENVGTNKTVTIAYNAEAVNSIKDANPNYQITWPNTTTASIHKVDAQIENVPQPNDLTYVAEADGNPKAQALVTGGSTVGNIGKIVYSTSQNGAYSTAIPTGTKAGTYSIWYKVADSVNYTGVPAAEVTVEIKKADPHISSNPSANGWGETLSVIRLEGGAIDVSGTFAWENGSIKPENGKSYNVIFTPNDEYKDNYNTRTIQVQVTEPVQSASIPPVSEPDTSGEEANISVTPAQTTTTVKNGAANTVLSATDGSKLVQGAVENQSQSVVIKPEITGSVTKSAVSIPSSTVSQLGSKTNAALTVSSPVADVTIPNRALNTLSSAGGTVDVVTEQTEQGVTLALTAGGKSVENVPGGVTVTVPAEDAGPGTVAVLVHEDGTRETIRKSVAGDGVMSVPLSGSATVEIVDNSKDFDDVPPESWASDAVDFASSHELFSGTSETTFSPDRTMSRGMLATVLYRLEGTPELGLTDLFDDVSNDAWYAEGVAWAADKGIAGGYGDGQFGPNNDVTREQFVVMLWRYAGSPAANTQTLDFVDADQASSYAQEALCWAVESGILHGVGNGVLDPGGTATRAQAAQLLKNFMENTR